MSETSRSPANPLCPVTYTTSCSSTLQADAIGWLQQLSNNGQFYTLQYLPFCIIGIQLRTNLCDQRVPVGLCMVLQWLQVQCLCIHWTYLTVQFEELNKTFGVVFDCLIGHNLWWLTLIIRPDYPPGWFFKLNDLSSDCNSLI